jgi:hypothetical protein
VSIFTIVTSIILLKLYPSNLSAVIAHAESIGRTLPGFIPADWETNPVPNTPLPSDHPEIGMDTTPAWDPSSWSPGPRPEDSGMFV